MSKKKGNTFSTIITEPKREKLEFFIGELMIKYKELEFQKRKKKVIDDVIHFEERNWNYFKKTFLRKQKWGDKKPKKFDDYKKVKRLIGDIIDTKYYRKKVSQKQLPSVSRPAFIQSIIDEQRQAKPVQYTTGKDASTKRKILNKWINGDDELQLENKCVKYYDDKTLGLRVIGICYWCKDPIHSMKDAGIGCSKCNRMVHFKCAPLLCAFETDNEKFPNFVCSKHYKNGQIFENQQTGYRYQWDQKHAQIKKYEKQRILWSKTRDIYKEDWVEIASWKWPSKEEIHRNRLCGIECGEPESNEEPINIYFNDPRKLQQVEYYKKDKLIFDYTKTYPVYDIGEIDDYKLIKYRFRNNKLSNGITIAYNAFIDYPWNDIQEDIGSVVSVSNETFKRYEHKTNTYDVKYHSASKKVYGKKHPKRGQLIYGEIVELIKRIKFYGKVGYFYGDDMRDSTESQELVESEIQHWQQVFTHFPHILNRIEQIWSDFEPKIYESFQVNKYLIGTTKTKDGKIHTLDGDISNHNDNPINSSDQFTEYHFDGPIYIIGIKGSGILSCGNHQHGSMYDETQQFKILPGSILRMEGYSWWHAKHCVTSGSIDQGQRIILILRPLHPSCDKIEHHNKQN